MTGPLWMPGAIRIPGRYPGTMDGTHGTRKVVLHTEGVDRGVDGRYGNAVDLARYVVAKDIGYHLIYDWSGRFAQIYPANVAARALKRHGDWSPNKQGQVALQVCFAGIEHAADTERWPLDNWHKFLQWAHDLGIPTDTHIDWRKPTRDRTLWVRSGWTCHAAAPGNDHRDGTGAPYGLLSGHRVTKSRSRRKRVVATTLAGRRRQVYRHRKTGRFGWRSGKRWSPWMTAAEARRAVKWTKKRRATAPRIVAHGQPVFVELSPGATWPTDRKLVTRLDTVGRRRRRRILIVSGKRTYSQQLALWRKWQAYRNGSGPPANLAAFPNSNAPHIRGVAADCGTIDRHGTYRSLGLDTRAAHEARELGLAALVPREPWHWQRRETY